MDQLQFDYLVLVMEAWIEGGKDLEHKSALLDTLVAIVQGANDEMEIGKIREAFLQHTIQPIAPAEDQSQSQSKLVKTVNIGERADVLERERQARETFLGADMSTRVKKERALMGTATSGSPAENERLRKREEKKLLRKGAKITGASTGKKPKVSGRVDLFVVQRRATSDSSSMTLDLRLENFDLHAPGVTLLKDANLTLSYGRHYCLVGRNGVGKSTLLRAMAERELPVAPHLYLLYVEQEVVGDETTVLDSVLQADQERHALVNREKELQAIEAPTPADDAALADVHRRLHEIEADKAVGLAGAILAGLGFTPEAQQRTTREYSGGWRMRVALARALFCQPDILFLDEPTNMLDIGSVLWLEQYLQKWAGTLLIVSHDRRFMNSVATDVVHFQGLQLTGFRGDYETFEKVRSEKIQNQKRAFEAQERHRQHIQAFIDRFRYNAKRASLVQSRIKTLDRAPVISAVMEDPSFAFYFDNPEPLQGPAVKFDDVSFSYQPGVEPNLFNNLEFTVQSDDRIALVGKNGMGKSTVLKIVAEQLKVNGGAVIRNLNCRMSMFSQHHVDQLDMDKSSLEFFSTTFPGFNAQHYRSVLGKYGITGDLALQPITTLSGGQKSRVVFAMIAMQQPHFMLLDEPTNHLDLDSVDVLCQALNTWTGGLLIVSHDERLITQVCSELWVVGDGAIVPWKGTFESYKQHLASSWDFTL